MTALVDLLRRNRIWQAAVVLMVLFTLYWSVFAARRYVSEAHVVVDTVQGLAAAVGLDVGSVFTPQATPPRDVLLLRDYVLSTDMLRKLDAELDLRGHYSASYDPFSRLLYREAPLEWLLRHYRSRISAEYDETAGVLVLQAQAYDPEMAQRIAAAIVREGDRFINQLAQNLAREQVAFAEREVAEANKRMIRARQAMLAYQNAHGLVSPTATVSELSAVVARLEGELSDLQARRSALESYLAPGAPDLVTVSEQIRAVEKQLRAQRTRLASGRNGSTLNRIAEEYDRLTLEASFHQAVYQTAMAALERARVDANRTLKKVSVVQQPTLPEYSTEPGRFYHSALYVFGTLIVVGILLLLIAIIREHRD